MQKIIEALRLNKNAGHIFIVCVLFLISFSNIYNLRFSPIDDELLIDPLFKVQGFGQYFKEFMNYKFLDLQPIRDLSYLIELKIFKFGLFNNFVLINHIIWIITCFLFDRILQKFEISKAVRLFIFSFIILHPSAFYSVNWVSARKHLLSVLFTTLSFYYVFHRKNLRNASPVFYLLGLLSQPINVIAGYWIILYEYFKTKKIITVRSILIVIFSLSVVGANLYYYKFIYPVVIQFDKFSPHDSFLNLEFLIFSISRHFQQLVFTPYISIFYDKGNDFVIASIILLPIYIYLLYKLTPRKVFFGGMLLIFTPLIPVTYKETNIFVSDTYLLLSVLGFAWILAHFKKKILYILMPILIINSIRVNLNTVSWIVSDSLIEESFKREKMPYLMVSRANKYFQKGQIDAAFTVSSIVVEQYPHYSAANDQLGSIILVHPGFSDEKKIELMNSYKLKIYYSFYLMQIYLKQGNIVQAFNEYRELINVSKKIRVRRHEATGIMLSYCMKFKHPQCEIVTSKYDSMKDSGEKKVVDEMVKNSKQFIDHIKAHP